MNDAVPTVTITLANRRSEDAAALVAALAAHLTTLYRPEVCHRLDLDELAKPDVRFWLARAGKTALGCAALRVMEGYGEVKRMYVAPEARGAGVGRRLLATVEEQARAERLPLLRLECGVLQPEALALYRSFGFTDRGPFACYPAAPESVFMEKPL